MKNCQIAEEHRDRPRGDHTYTSRRGEERRDPNRGFETADGSSMGVRVTSLRWIARNPVSARRRKDGERRTEERGVPDERRGRGRERARVRCWSRCHGAVCWCRRAAWVTGLAGPAVATHARVYVSARVVHARTHLWRQQRVSSGGGSSEPTYYTGRDTGLNIATHLHT